MKVEQSINQIIQNIPHIATNDISDGYHSFGELYEHRVELYIALLRSKAAGAPFKVWKSKQHSDGTESIGWFLLGYDKEPGRQITYHLPIDKWADCSFAEELHIAPPFDGHTPQDVLQRLKNI